MRLWGTVMILSTLALAGALSPVPSSRALESPARAGASSWRWSCDELNTRWKTYHAELHVRWAYASFTCPSPLSSFVEAMALLHDLVPPQPERSAGHVSNYFAWLAATSRGIDYADQETAGAMAHYHGTGVITIMNPFFKAPLIQRAEMLVHEGRHAMWPADPGHVTCDQGEERGLAGGCDAEFHREDAGGGGYSWGWVFMWHLMEDPRAAAQEHAQILAVLKWELNNRFNVLGPDDKSFFMKRWNWDGL